MTFIDLAIIYLACGAPLSMHYFFGANRKLNPYFAAKMFLVAIVWPIVAFLLVREVRLDRVELSKSGHNDLDQKLDAMRIEIERSAFANERAASVFEFRELFARYTGLAQASTITETMGSVNEIFTVTNHLNADLAARCLDRKASNRLARHADAARTDFVDHVAALSIDSEDVVATASAIAEMVGDRAAIRMLCDLEGDAAAVSPNQWKVPDQLHASVS